jgi:Right handed beta helix region/Secretion system C-terminal sorting domain
MRNYSTLVFAFILLFTSSVSARDFYIAANGNNNNSGLSASVPWQSISKLNASFGIIAAGDNIYFRRGDTFYGVIIVGKSGASSKPITFSAYGTGAKPIITGFVRATSWVAVSNGVYQTYVPGTKSTLNMVTMNNVPKALGRYPNANAANGGYLNYETFSGSTSITDNQFTSSTNWTGAEAVVRKKLWVLDRCKITAHSGGRLTFTNTNSSTYTGTNGYGYFIQNDPRTLDQLGEWYRKASTKYLQMYFGTASPSSYTIKVSNIDTLVRLVSRSYINFNNLVFEGANDNAIYGNTGGFINIQNCDFINAGNGAINMRSISNLLIENCTTNYILSNSIIVTSSKVSNVTIRGCSIKNTATLPGMGLSNGNSYKGIVTTVLSNTLLEYNRVDTTGYVGIEFQGSNVNIRYNVVNYFDFVKDDAGGIYTYSSGSDASPGPTYTNRVISNNIVMNGVGAPYGRNSSTLFVTGIYLDGRTMNVSVLNNTVFNNGKNGIHCNNPNTVTIRGNTSFNNLNAMSVMRWATLGAVRGFTVKGNTFYPKVPDQRGFYYGNSGLNQPATTSVKTAITNLGSIDSNTYSMINPTAFNFEVYGTTGGALIQTSPLSLEGWRANSTHDMKGKKPAKLPMSYKLISLVGANKFANTALTAGISGLTVFGTGTLGSWDNTGKIAGGSIKVTFSLPAANKYSLIHSPIGAVSSAKKYVLRFSTYGTTQQGIVRAYIRKTTSPYNNLVATQTQTFGIGKVDHEFLFSSPTTATAGNFVIELEQNSGTTYIDNITFYEATASVYDPTAQIRFEYNATKVAKTVALDASYTAVNGTVYSSSVTLQPFTSIILVKNVATTALAKAASVDSTIIDSTLSDAAIFSEPIDLAATLAADSAAAVKTGSTKADTLLAARSAPVITANKPLLLNAFPNPAASQFNLTLQGGSSDRVTIMVYTFDGKMVYQTTGNSNSRYSFGNNFAPGMYVAKVVQGNNVQTLKLVKSGN